VKIPKRVRAIKLRQRVALSGGPRVNPCLVWGNKSETCVVLSVSKSCSVVSWILTGFGAWGINPILSAGPRCPSVRVYWPRIPCVRLLRGSEGSASSGDPRARSSGAVMTAYFLELSDYAATANIRLI